MRERPSDVKNHLVNISASALGRALLPPSVQDQPQRPEHAPRSGASRPLHMLGSPLGRHFLAWKASKQYSTTVKKYSPLINSSTIVRASFSLFGAQCFQYKLFSPNSHICFLFRTRFYKFTEGRDYILFVVISSGTEDEKLNICLIKYMSEYINGRMNKQNHTCIPPAPRNTLC